MIQSLDRIADKANRQFSLGANTDANVVADLVMRELAALGAMGVHISEDSSQTPLVRGFMSIPVPQGTHPEEVALVFRVIPGLTDYSGTVVPASVRDTTYN